MAVKASSEFDYEICNNRIRPIAEALISKYEELRHIDPDKILFLVNHKSSGSKTDGACQDQQDLSKNGQRYSTN